MTWLLLCCVLSGPPGEPPSWRPGFDTVKKARMAPAKLKVTARTVFVVAGKEVAEKVFFATAGEILRIDVEADGESVRRIEAERKK